MTEEPTVKIKLKTPMLDLNGKPILQGDRLRTIPKCLEMNDEEFFIFTKTTNLKELNELTPKNVLGEAFVHILNNCIKPDNAVKAAANYSYITKFTNKLTTDKAEWIVTKEELSKFMELVKTAKEKLNPIVIGQVLNTLEEYYAELVELNKNPKK